MVDKVSKETRSRNMSHIHSKNTTPEILVRKYLFSRGLRYRLYDKRLPGKPDLVFPRYKTVVFVNGCFWHCHNCKHGSIPKSNTEFWIEKLHKNHERDIKNYEELKEMGWNVMIVWECELTKDKVDNTLSKTYEKIISNK